MMFGVLAIQTFCQAHGPLLVNSWTGAGMEHDDNIPLRITLRLLDVVYLT